ncbi:hypothetical protein [Deinococcus gobiensis]|uniref:Uncharacterized protein n=1 Tax=Deinococcus gobiensis (strain DSM 21396 / JCM 16679 / CGMCC 1.7299 / I-0) TaxID=745776 RepID=H8H1Y5_DEIGI|nr:hypothetical protein [Deinococcus gobiensis]AFD27532.1 hypothetical protein DGo_PB0263 [Deinococcus gobiensis I-0]
MPLGRSASTDTDLLRTALTSGWTGEEAHDAELALGAGPLRTDPDLWRHLVTQAEHYLARLFPTAS